MSTVENFKPVTHHLGMGHKLIRHSRVIAWRHIGPNGGPCGGQMALDGRPNHAFLEGGPDDLSNATIAPSLSCTGCGAHGWIKKGRWVPA